MTPPPPVPPMAAPEPAPGYPAGPGLTGYPPPYQGQPARAGRTNTTAIVALVLALAGFITILSAPIGAILGHVARRQIRETGEEGDGMALAAIIVGWTLTGLVLVGCCLAGFVIIAGSTTTTVR